MAKDVVIRISATDAASPVFKKIGAEATASANQITAGNEKAAASTERFSKSAAALGAAMGAGILLMGEFAQKAAEDQVTVERLRQSVEDTGKSYEDYAAQIDQAIKKGQEKAFSDEQTRDALVKLNLVTNDTGKSLDELGLAMDFARARNIDLGTSAEIIAKVYGGNLGILARYGIAVDKNASATEALALIQQRSAGQAETYANTAAGQAEIIRDRFNEATEAMGRHAGQMQTLLLLLPGLRAGYVALAGALSGFAGVGGLGAIAGIAGPLALLAGGAGLAYGYSQDSYGTTKTNEFWNEFFKKGSAVMNALLPGTPYDISKYTGKEAQNAAGTDIMNTFGFPGEKSAVAEARFNALIPAFNSSDPAAKGAFGYYGDDLKQYVIDEAAKMGLSVQSYLKYVVQKAVESGKFYLDPVSGIPLTFADWKNVVGNRAQAAGAGTAPSDYRGMQPGAGITVPYDPNSFNYRAGPTLGNPNANRVFSGGRTSADQSDAAYFQNPDRYPLGNYRAGPTANQTDTNRFGMMQGGSSRDRDVIAAIGEQNTAYLGLVEGINSANDAQMAFKATQDGLLQSEQQYSGQLTEYKGQVDAITAAHDVLNQRVADGIPLTQQQQEFQDKYNEALTRGNGAVDDATVSQGLLAEQYLLNMEQGDKMNEALAGQTDAVGSLVDEITLLIYNMAGIPEEVKTQILLSGNEAVLAQIYAIQYALNQAAGTYVATFEVYTVGGNAPGGPQFANGGTVAMSNGGTAYDPILPHYAGGGTWAVVGERGPELTYLSRGDQVFHTEASRSMMGGGRGGRGITVHGSINVMANDARDLEASLREQATGSARG